MVYPIPKAVIRTDLIYIKAPSGGRTVLLHNGEEMNLNIYINSYKLLIISFTLSVFKNSEISFPRSM